MLWYLNRAWRQSLRAINRGSRHHFHDYPFRSQAKRGTDSLSEQQQQARILIAEDEANLRLVLQKELERLGYRVQAAPDGEAALRKLEESNVDVLLCDIN